MSGSGDGDGRRAKRPPPLITQNILGGTSMPGVKATPKRALNPLKRLKEFATSRRNRADIEGQILSVSCTPNYIWSMFAVTRCDRAGRCSVLVHTDPALPPPPAPPAPSATPPLRARLAACSTWSHA